MQLPLFLFSRCYGCEVASFILRRARTGFRSDTWAFWLRFLFGVRKTSKVKLIFSTSDPRVVADIQLSHTGAIKNPKHTKTSQLACWAGSGEQGRGYKGPNLKAGLQKGLLSFHILENSWTVNVHLKWWPLSRWKSNIYFIVQFSRASSLTLASDGAVTAAPRAY